MNVDFYKELHNRELNRRKEIEDGINIPIGLITLMIGLISYFFQEESQFLKECLSKILIILIILALLISAFYISMAFNNFLKGYEYEYLPKPKELFNYESGVTEFNSTVKKSERENFEYYLKENFAKIADFNKSINDKRAEYLSYSKKAIIVALIFSLILVLIFILKNLYNV